MPDTPPTRDPQTPGYVMATMLPDGDVPPVGVDGNFVVGPTHASAPEVIVTEGVPTGVLHELVMKSEDSRIYPGIARDAGTLGRPDPDNPARLMVITSRPKPYTRRVTVYVPEQYASGTVVPFIVGADGPDLTLFRALENLINEGRVPVMIGISISNGGGDAQGSQRGREYDTMSGVYAQFVETEVLPRVEAECNVRLTRDPDGRAATGCSSGAACAMIMAWYRPDLYGRVLSFSGTYVNQQWPYNPETPLGAWEFHKSIIPNSEPRPLRIWMAVADRDLCPDLMPDDAHDWVLANERMAHVLADKGYRYQFSFVRNAGHCDPAMRSQLMPQALEWLWRGYAAT
jgi:enterochelin esterase family protein